MMTLEPALGPVTSSIDWGVIALAGQRPADQELADVIGGDRELLAGLVLDDDPLRRDVDDLGPGPPGRASRAAGGPPLTNGL